jgi:hypothetical protein
MKYLLITLLFYAQFGLAQVHIKNQQFLQLNLGGFDSYTPLSGSYSSSIEWGKYNKKLNSKIIGFAINHKKASAFSEGIVNFKIPITQYFGFFKSDVTFFRNANKVFHIKGTGQFNLGYESINRESTRYEDYTLTQKSDYLLGIGVGLQMEYCPVVLGITESINFLSNYQKLNTLPYLGFRYHFK